MPIAWLTAVSTKGCSGVVVVGEKWQMAIMVVEKC